MIKQKVGVCPDCPNSDPKPLIAGRCSNHYWKYRASLKDAPKQKQRAPIPKIGDKEAKRRAAYNAINAIYAKEHPYCMAAHLVDEIGEPCSFYHTEPPFAGLETHHGAGRIGWRLFAKKYFRRLCLRHHRWAEGHPEAAKAVGLSFDRLTVKP